MAAVCRFRGAKASSGASSVTAKRTAAHAANLRSRGGAERECAVVALAAC